MTNAEHAILDAQGTVRYQHGVTTLTMKTVFLLIEFSPQLFVGVLCALAMAGVILASITEESEHGDDGHGSDKADGHGH